MKNDSPPSTERLRPFMMPPLVSVLMLTALDIDTIAPASACTDSPASIVTVAIRERRAERDLSAHGQLPSTRWRPKKSQTRGHASSAASTRYIGRVVQKKA